ncbi:helix-turn-helix transcriptional regulator [Herbaspirillum sp. WKF16]|uniref:helix-turn-helix domain-containing protein n=1 Tax=Herbaspirillum sp. WKF16 TaxID=3028312 RepID=UPI0023A99599|nr:helix-turn-helix transcriptional regulator [Herbaspirillum sp. WKF16]WDZ96407.1 helix-turn-helix transcriptional regulator [Herbaspirillum sp. WKF16]
MPDYHVRTASQLTALLQAYRKQAGLTQAEAAARLGVTQQTLSALERNADKAGADRLLELLNVLGVEVILRKRTPSESGAPSPDKPVW